MNWKCLLGRHNWLVCVSPIFAGEKSRVCLDCHKYIKERNYIKQKAFLYGFLTGLAIGVSLLILSLESL